MVGESMALAESTWSSSESARRTVRIGVVTAFPPGRHSLNEFGLHLARHLSRQPAGSEVIAYVDAGDAGAPEPMPNVSFRPCWRFNDPATLFRVTREILRTNPDAVLFNLQFAT